MPTTSSKKPSISKGAKPAGTGAPAKSTTPARTTGGKAARALTTRKRGKSVVTGRQGAAVPKTVATHGAGSTKYRLRGPRTSTDALPQMITRRITVRDQTTIPPVVRELLGLKGGGELGYVFDQQGVRLVNPATVGEHVDPVLQQFLALLGSHIAAGPAGGGAIPFPPALFERARALTADVEIDHDAPLEGAMLL